MTDGSFVLEPELAVAYCRREGWQRNYKVAFRRRRLINFSARSARGSTPCDRCQSSRVLVSTRSRNVPPNNQPIQRINQADGFRQ